MKREKYRYYTDINESIAELEKALNSALETRTSDERLDTLTQKEYPLLALTLGHENSWEGNRVIADIEEKLLDLRARKAAGETKLDPQIIKE